MNRQEILEKMEKLENMLDQIDEDEEEKKELQKCAKKSATAIKMYLDECEKAGIDRDLAVELLKLGVANQQ